MEWSDEMVLEFLHNYEAERIIWDPKDANHKKKHLVADAWRRLKSNLSFENSTTIEELKKKKDSLMAYYRIHLNKIKNSKKSGMGSEEAYKTNWFAFSTMNSFLAPIYECSATINTEEQVEQPNTADESTSSSHRSQTVDYMSKKRRQQGGVPDILQAKKQMDEAFSMIKERAAASQNQQERVHECDLYAQLLAEKLKKIDEDRRIILMHNIDNMVFQEIMATRKERPASVASTYTSPSQLNHDIILSSSNSPFMVQPSSPSPNPHNIQSTQPFTLTSDHEIVILQSQEPSYQPVHPSPQIQSLPSTSISVQSPQPLSLSQNDRNINVLSQKIIHSGTQIQSLPSTSISVQSPQPLSLSQNDRNINVLSQKIIHSGTQIQSLPSTSISVQSPQPLSLSQNDRNTNVVSQKIIHSDKDILAKAYYSIIDKNDSARE